MLGRPFLEAYYTVYDYVGDEDDEAAPSESSGSEEYFYSRQQSGLQPRSQLRHYSKANRHSHWHRASGTFRRSRMSICLHCYRYSRCCTGLIRVIIDSWVYVTVPAAARPPHFISLLNPFAPLMILPCMPFLLTLSTRAIVYTATLVDIAEN